MLPARADAVVVGAGAFGLSVAWWLARLGNGRVVLLDQFLPGSQASPRAAGLFKLIQADETRTRLARLAVEIVTRFEALTGTPLAIERSGSLLIARTPDHARMLDHERAQSAAWGVDLEAVDGAEASRRMPALAPQTIRAAVHTPGDVYIEEPASLLQAWLQALDTLGVAVLGDTPVTGIRVINGAVSAVRTSQGDIETGVVVDAAGAWSRAVARLAGVATPIVALRHQLFITDPVPGVAPEHPIVRMMDSAVYVRPARGGLMLGGFEADPLPLDPRERPGFSMADVPLDLRVLRRLEERVAGQFPVLRDAGLAEHRGGLFTMTPDGRFLAGPSADARGLWLATGCNGSGFSFSPAIGQVLAELIVGNEPSIDIASLAPGRFAAPLEMNEEQLRAACVWQYAHYYTPDAEQPHW